MILHCIGRRRIIKLSEGYYSYRGHAGWGGPPAVCGHLDSTQSHLQVDPRRGTCPFGGQPLRQLLRIQVDFVSLTMKIYMTCNSAFRDIGHDSGSGDDEEEEETTETNSQEKESGDKASTDKKESSVKNSGDSAKGKELETEVGKAGRENSGGKKRKASEERASSAEKKKKEAV